MDANKLLAQFSIPTPCPMDWDRMSGDDRVRHCEACGKHVYNLTAMSSDEIVSLLSPLSEQGGELCGQVFQRPDGTLVASECRPDSPARKGWRFSIRSLMAAIAALAAALGFSRWFETNSGSVRGAIMARPPSVTTGPGGPASSPGGIGGADSECTAGEPAP